MQSAQDFTRAGRTVFLLAVSWLVGSMAWAEQYALLVGVREYDRTQLTSLTYAEHDDGLFQRGRSRVAGGRRQRFGRRGAREIPR